MAKWITWFVLWGVSRLLSELSGEQAEGEHAERKARFTLKSIRRYVCQSRNQTASRAALGSTFRKKPGNASAGWGGCNRKTIKQ